MERYLESKIAFDQEKNKIWSSLPEQPPIKLPKKKMGQPWFDREMEDKQAGFLPKDENGDLIWDMEERIAKLRMEEKEELQRQEAEEAKAKKEEEVKGGKEKEKPKKPWEELVIDEDKLVAKWTGQEGLIVPEGVYQPKEKAYPGL